MKNTTSIARELLAASVCAFLATFATAANAHYLTDVEANAGCIGYELTAVPNNLVTGDFIQYSFTAVCNGQTTTLPGTITFDGSSLMATAQQWNLSGDCTVSGLATLKTATESVPYPVLINGHTFGSLDCGTPTCRQNTHSIIATLGQAGPSHFAVLSLGGDSSHPKAGIYCSNGTVNGNIGIASYGKFTNMAPCVENGTFYTGANVTYTGPGKLNGPTITDEDMLDGARTDAIRAWDHFKGLQDTGVIGFPSDGKISGDITVTGQPGLNVINLPGLTLNGNLTFTGDPGAQFVLNIHGTFDLHKGNISTSGGVGPYDVVYNIVATSAAVKTMVPTTAVGILLAPYNAINAMDSADFFGEIIGGYNQVITLLSGTRVVPPNPPPPCQEPDNYLPM